MRNTFYENVLENVKRKIDAEKYDVELYRTNKNNGVVRTGICIRDNNQDNTVSPVIYLDDYYEQYINEINDVEIIEHVGKKIMRIYNEIATNPFTMLDAFLTKEFILANVFIQLVNTHDNLYMLKDVPSRELFNLSIIYKCLVKNNDEGIAAFLIRNSTLEKAGLTEEEVYKAGLTNTKEYFPIICKTMRDMVEDMIEDMDELIENSPMYVMTNKQQSLGANALIYPEYFEKLSSVVEDNLIIFPSSIHELIILPASLISIKEANIMLNSINPTIDAEDYLGNRAFYYDRENKELKIT